MASINVTVGMTPQMLAAVDQEWEDDPRFGSRAEYIRACVRSDTEVQLPCEEHEIEDEPSFKERMLNDEDPRKGAA